MSKEKAESKPEEVKHEEPKPQKHHVRKHHHHGFEVLDHIGRVIGHFGDEESANSHAKELNK